MPLVSPLLRGLLSPAQLITVAPGGGPSATVLGTCSAGDCSHLTMGEVIPDGSGGVIAAWQDENFQSRITHVATAAILPGELEQGMVLGDEGTYFVTDGGQLAAVDLASDSPRWTWQAPSGSIEIMAATSGGGVTLAKGTESQGGQVSGED